MMKRYIMAALLAVSSGFAVGAAKSGDFLGLVSQARAGLGEVGQAIKNATDNQGFHVDELNKEDFQAGVQKVRNAIAGLKARFVGVKGQADLSQTVKNFESQLGALLAGVPAEASDVESAASSRRGSLASNISEKIAQARESAIERKRAAAGQYPISIATPIISSEGQLYSSEGQPQGSHEGAVELVEQVEQVEGYDPMQAGMEQFFRSEALRSMGEEAAKYRNK